MLTFRVRRGFTLVELTVAIAIIGMLAGLALGGMWRADVAAKETNTKTTIAKVSAQLNEIWDSYRNRRLPVAPLLILQSGGSPPYTAQYANAVNWLKYYSNVRTACGSSAIYPDPLAPPGFNGVNPQNNLQIAALKLAATHELMRLELPCRFSDFTSSPPGTTPANAAAVQTLLIPQTPGVNPAGLSEQYRQFFIQNAKVYNTEFESAECLYMIIRFASQNELGQEKITDDLRLVGDADGDGMPEIQDAFACGYGAAPDDSRFSRRNMPISFIRWPVGFVSDLQPGPRTPQTAGSWSATVEYATARHEIFDALKIDPRAFSTTPLVFSAGVTGSAVAPYSDYDIWEGHSYAGLSSTQQALAQNDPYYTQNMTPIFPLSANAMLDPLPGTQMDAGVTFANGSIGSGAYADNITNHNLSARF